MIMEKININIKREHNRKKDRENKGNTLTIKK
jgi:hypothetical protein